MTAPHDRPTAVELVVAVREFLAGELLDSTGLDQATRWHLRVAVNALRIVERELGAGPGPAAEHDARLAGLGVGSDAELAAAIRSGRLDPRSAEVVAAITDSVRAKLAVANPDYLGGRR